MAEHVKVYEEKKKGLPIWAWLLPLLLLLAVLAYLLSRHHQPAAGDTPAVSQNSPSTPAVGAFPDLGAVHFDPDKATLTPEGQATLDRAAEAMKGNPNVHLRLEGFTDSTGNAAHNQSLADQRTLAVASYLQAHGVEHSRLTGQGFGAEKPADTNATNQGKADNRRVELFSQQ